MDKIKWCLEQKKGLELVEPNSNLREAYVIKAEEALDKLRTSKSRDWQLTACLLYDISWNLFNFYGNRD